MNERDYMICSVIELTKHGEGDVVFEDRGVPLQVTDHQIGGVVEIAVNVSKTRVYIKLDLADLVRLVMNQKQGADE